MSASRVLCRVWQQHVKEFFARLHGHQSKTLALFVLGAIKAESIVIQRVAEALLAESDAKAPRRGIAKFFKTGTLATKDACYGCRTHRSHLDRPRAVNQSARSMLTNN